MANADDVDKKMGNAEHDMAKDYLCCDKLIEGICNLDDGFGGCECIDKDSIIDHDATKVESNFVSCHIGETIMPAIKEETQVEQEACYTSDQIQAYEIKGNAGNAYKLSGGLNQWTSRQTEGMSDCNSCVEVEGSKHKKFYQKGNKSINDCNCCECDSNFGIRDHLLEEDATEMVSDPNERVNQYVDQVVRDAISKTISQAVEYALHESLQGSIHI